MTRAYLESETSRRSSIGGSVMPSGWATVPGICSSFSQLKWRNISCYPLPDRCHGGVGWCAPLSRVVRADEVHELVGGAFDVVVDDGVVEFVFGGELDLRRGQAPSAFLGVLGAAPHEPGD